MAGLQMLCLLVFTWLSMIKGNRAAVEVRLVDGKTPHDGRVEVRRNNGPWKSICDYGTWNLRRAYVVCRMLNYTKAVSAGSTKVQGDYRQFTNSMPLCDGDETSIDQCQQYYFNCQYWNKDAATVGCENLTAEEKAIKVRLVGTNVSHVGQVEIRYNGTWGAVCDWYWDIKDAHVICRMLGYKAAEGKIYNIEGESRTKLVMDEVRCTGNETSIAGCYHKGWFNVKICKYQQLAGVVCQVNGEPPPIQVRLAGGIPTSPSSGRVEGRFHGMWLSVCNENVAKVACHMYGYRGVHVTRRKRSIASVKSKFWLYWSGCSGAEMSINNCSSHWSLGKSTGCNQDGVRCTPVSQPVITASEALPCTAELTLNSTTNTDIENKLIQFYYIQLINKHSNSSSSLLVAGSASNVTIGDGKFYNGIYNKPLEPGSTYYIRVRAVTSTHDRGYAYGDTNLIVFTTSLCTNTKDQIQTSLLLIIICGSLSLFC